METQLNYKDQINLLRVEASKLLDDLIDKGARCALLDFPNYSNVGDRVLPPPTVAG